MAEKKFGTRTFRVRDPLATEALMLQARLLQIIGGGVDRLPTIIAGMGTDKPEEVKNASNAALVAALGDIFSKTEPKRTVALISDIISMADVQGASGEYGTADVDQDFSGKENAKFLFPVLAWILSEVLGDFFGGVLASGRLQKIVRDLQ